MRPEHYLKPLKVRGRIARPQPLGLPIVNMGFNELPYPPSPPVLAALTETAGRVQSYGSPLNDALRGALGRKHGLNPDQIICGNGSEELLDVIARNFVRAGDGVVISQYGYIQFEMTANRLGARLTKAVEQDFTTDISAILAAVSDDTKLVFLANPNNPTGTTLPAGDLADLAAGLPPSVVLVLDLAYGEFTGADYCAEVHGIVEKHENVVVTRTFSKAYGLAGARVGWCHAPEWMLPGFYAARGMGSVNALAQAAALAGLDDYATVERRVGEIVSERDRLCETLAQMGVATLPSQSNFLLATISNGTADDTEALVEHLFTTCGIVVNRTREAGLERFMRFSLSMPAHNDLLLNGVRGFLAA